MAPVDATTNNYNNDTSSTTSESSTNQAPHHDVHVESINRVSSIPVVKSALGIASGFYSRVKTSNSMVGSGLSRAEQTVQLVADSAKPVIQKLEKPSEYSISVFVPRDLSFLPLLCVCTSTASSFHERDDVTSKTC